MTSKRPPKLETRIKWWYAGDQDDAEGAELLAELYEKQQKRKPANQGRRSRKKGQEFQTFLARALAVVFPWACSGSQYRGGSKDGCDVEKTSYYIEAKDQKTLSIPAWWKKLLSDRKEAGDEREPALIFRVPSGHGNAVDTLVTVRLEEFVRLQRLVKKLFRVTNPGAGKSYFFDDDAQIGSSEERVRELRMLFKAFVNRGPSRPFEPVLNPKKGSDGLWYSLDAAEAAVRRAASDA